MIYLPPSFSTSKFVTFMREMALLNVPLMALNSSPLLSLMKAFTRQAGRRFEGMEIGKPLFYAIARG